MQNKAKSMFSEDGIGLDLSAGYYRYFPFERSASMSRKSQLTFIRDDFYEEFLSYTGVPVYVSVDKQDYSYLVRIAFATILDFEGLPRIFSIIARGYMYGGGEPNTDRARNALCAWCSIPDKKETATREEWQYKSDFRELHKEFPEHLQEKVSYLVAYYLAHKPDDSDWVVLPVVFFDAFFSGTTFSKKILSRLPKNIIIRDRTGYGVSRYKVPQELMWEELKRREAQKVFGK